MTVTCRAVVACSVVVVCATLLVGCGDGAGGDRSSAAHDSTTPSSAAPSSTASLESSAGSSDPPDPTTSLPPAADEVDPLVPATPSPDSSHPPPPPAPEGVAHVFPLDPPSAGSYSGGGHAYPATDIFAPRGTAFVAVTSGTVQGVSRVDRYDPAVDDPALRSGLFVSVIGDDGVRYFGSHLQEVAAGVEAGERVEAGQILGRVGSSGNAVGTAPHLHFGLSRPTTLDDWETRRGEIDPVPYLDAWRSGDPSATPTLP